MSNDFFFSDDDKPKKDAATIPPLAFWLLPRDNLRRRLWWLNHRQSQIRRNLLCPLQSVRKGEQQWLLLLRFISPLLLLTMCGTALLDPFGFWVFKILIQLVFCRLWCRSFFLLVLNASRFRRPLMHLKVFSIVLVIFTFIWLACSHTSVWYWCLFPCPHLLCLTDEKKMMKILFVS
jgi:hypothetical protein